ncbi:MAG: deoxynucleoside kinase [Acutalibacteraceae bacterium]|nr:deoxynucleoside kinase [Clostridiales bacterium]
MKRLIVIEGLDGSGKSTQVEILKNALQEKSVDVKQIKLPDYENPSSTLVKMYLNGDFGASPKDVNAYAASTFYAVDRFASFTKKWKNDFENGTLILADRYTTSNASHQMVKLPKSEWASYLNWLEDFEYNKVGIPKPNLVIYLDMPVEISQKLMTSRYDGDEVKKDVHECNVEYLKACRQASLYAVKELGWKCVECSNGDMPRSIEEISKDIMHLVLSEVL